MRLAKVLPFCRPAGCRSCAETVIRGDFALLDSAVLKIVKERHYGDRRMKRWMRWMGLKGLIRRMRGDAVSTSCSDSVEMQSGRKGPGLGPVR